MGNSSLSHLPSYDCFDENISRNSVTPEYWESHSINDSFKASSTFTAVCLLLFMLIGLPGNAVIIVSIIQNRLYKETTHILLLNLAISDFMVCLLFMPFNVVAGFAGGYVFGGSDYTRCQVCQTGLIFLVLTVLSVNILGLISIDRFIFIKFPLRYKNWVTVPRILVVVTITWLLSILEAILPLFGFGETKYAYPIAACIVNLTGYGKLTSNLYYGVLLVVLALPSVIITVVINIWIACIVRKQIRKVYRTRRSFGNKEDLKRYNQGLRKNIHKQRNQKHLVLIRAFGAILIANMIVWMPCVILVTISLFVNGRLIPLGLYVFVYVTFISHTVVHSLVEGCFIPDIKATFKKLITGPFRCKKISRKRKQSAAIAMLDLPVSNDSESCDITLEDGVQGRPCKKCCDLFSLAVLPNDEETTNSVL